LQSAQMTTWPLMLAATTEIGRMRLAFNHLQLDF
jgi:hypothetical protein